MEPPVRPAFKSVCGLATELSVLITITDRKSNSDHDIFYKDDQDRFRQRLVFHMLTRVTKFLLIYFQNDEDKKKHIALGVPHLFAGNHDYHH